MSDLIKRAKGFLEGKEVENIGDLVADLLEQLKQHDKNIQFLEALQAGDGVLISENEILKARIDELEKRDFDYFVANAELVKALNDSADFIENMSYDHNFNDCGKAEVARDIANKYEVKSE